jgi:hypothetical protein
LQLVIMFRKLALVLAMIYVRAHTVIRIGFRPLKPGKHRYTYMGGGETNPGQFVFEGTTATAAECFAAMGPPPGEGEGEGEPFENSYGAGACAQLDNDGTLDAWMVGPDGLFHFIDDVTN